MGSDEIRQIKKDSAINNVGNTIAYSELTTRLSNWYTTNMKTAIFHNFTKEPFVGYWDGKKRTFAPGAQKLLPAYLAEHYATHLTNKVLIERGDITSTSPKKPDQVPKFMELFEKACQFQEDDDEEENDDVEMPIQNVRQDKKVRTIVDDKPPQMIGSPVDDDDDESFEGLNKSTPAPNEEQE